MYFKAVWNGIYREQEVSNRITEKRKFETEFTKNRSLDAGLQRRRNQAPVFREQQVRFRFIENRKLEPGSKKTGSQKLVYREQEVRNRFIENRKLGTSLQVSKTYRKP